MVTFSVYFPAGLPQNPEFVLPLFLIFLACNKVAPPRATPLLPLNHHTQPPLLHLNLVFFLLLCFSGGSNTYDNLAFQRSVTFPVAQVYIST